LGEGISLQGGDDPGRAAGEDDEAIAAAEIDQRDDCGADWQDGEQRVRGL